MTFETAFNILLALEGGISDHVNDKGGLTKYGISQRQYPAIDIRNLTIKQAKEIYRRDYWDRLRCDQLHDDKLKLEIFDFGVNAGQKRSARKLQKALSLIGFPVKIDGVIGSETIGQINSATVKYSIALINTFRGYQFMHYLAILKRDESQLAFVRGWMARI